MKALVTGATGFVGSHLVERLLDEGASVAVVRRAQSDLWRIAEFLPRVRQIVGDLRDLAAIEEPIRAFQHDTVFHLAWYGVSGPLRNDPAQIEDNLPSSLALLRLAARIGCRAWIGLGSQDEYGPQNRAIDESVAPRPTSLYGTVKLCPYLLARQQAAAGAMRMVWLRLFSAYGPKDHPRAMLPQLMETLLRGEKPALTAGEQKWDYVYVADAAEAIYRAALCPSAEGVYNLGSGRAFPLRRTVELARDRIAPGLPLGFGEIPYAANQVMHLEADVRRLCAQTGWSPRVSLEEGLSRTAAWHVARWELERDCPCLVSPGRDVAACAAAGHDRQCSEGSQNE
jgi:nucleoside-diphosphate-sugar epimerase